MNNSGFKLVYGLKLEMLLHQLFKGYGINAAIDNISATFRSWRVFL